MSRTIGKIKTLSHSFTACYFNKYSFATRIKELVNFTKQIECTSVKGWVKSIRRLKTNMFIDLNDGSSCKTLQIVIAKNKISEKLSYGCSIQAHGNLVEQHNNQYEFHASQIEIIGNCNIEEYPFRPKKQYSNEYIRQHLQYRFRTNKFASLLRVRDKAVIVLNEYFKNNNYINIHAPVLTGNDCEGAGEVFTVLPKGMCKDNSPINDRSEEFFNKKVNLSVSAQLHLEAASRGMGDVYSFGPIFRAENSKSRLHLSEFYMLEAETAFVSSLDDVMFVVEDLIKYITTKLIEECYDDIHNCRSSSESSDDAYLFEKFIENPFKKITFDEATKILLKNEDKLSIGYVPEGSFTKEQELLLVKLNMNRPLFVINWPVKLKPFYMKVNPQETDKVLAFDLLCPLVGEISGGSIREDNYENLKQTLEHLNLQEKLEWYLDLRKFGNVPTGGFGLGFERFLQILLTISNIKDVIPFPRYPYNCKM